MYGHSHKSQACWEKVKGGGGREGGHGQEARTRTPRAYRETNKWDFKKQTYFFSSWSTTYYQTLKKKTHKNGDPKTDSME